MPRSSLVSRCKACGRTPSSLAPQENYSLIFSAYKLGVLSLEEMADVADLLEEVETTELQAREILDPILNALNLSLRQVWAKDDETSICPPCDTFTDDGFTLEDLE